MRAYLDIVKNVLEIGEKIDTRQGIPAYTIAGAIFEHDMSKGFPLLTTKKMPFRLISTELEFFINAITDKKWLIDHNNHIWDEWASPKKAPYESYDSDYTNKGVDQLKRLVEILKTNPRDRRMIVNAWNPLQLEEMGLPPCHYSFQVTVINNKINLMWNQRSVDTMLGLPFNIASYALLLSLLAKESGLKEGKLVGFLADVHLFENHVEGAKEQLSRDPNKYPLPTIKTDKWESIFNWKAEDTIVLKYESHPRIPFEIAI